MAAAAHGIRQQDLDRAAFTVNAPTGQEQPGHRRSTDTPRTRRRAPGRRHPGSR